VLQLYWEHIGLGNYEPLDAVDLLVQRSLLTPAGKDTFIFHDLLRDYLVFQADGEIAELHRQLLEAYKATYPGGWHTIPYAPPFYFLDNWIFHVKKSGDTAQASEIAESLIWHQPRLHIFALWDALNFVDYEFEDIANDLLKFNQNEDVQAFCGKIVADKENEAAQRKAKEKEEEFKAIMSHMSDQEKDILYNLHPEIAQWVKEWHD
jgi:hypothetical protein